MFRTRTICWDKRHKSFSDKTFFWTTQTRKHVPGVIALITEHPRRTGLHVILPCDHVRCWDNAIVPVVGDFANGQIPDHAAFFRQETAVRDLPVRFVLPVFWVRGNVRRHRILHQLLRLWSRDLELAERRQVEHGAVVARVQALPLLVLEPRGIGDFQRVVGGKGGAGVGRMGGQLFPLGARSGGAGLGGEGTVLPTRCAERRGGAGGL